MTRIRVGLGALSAQTVTGSATETGQELDLLIRSCVAAEAAGLDSVWVSEHHFSDDAYLPAPIPVLAALARETDRLALATNVAIGPLYDPVRLAEDVAVVDQLSGGRVLLGLGLGYRQAEFDGLGVDRTQRGAQQERLVAFLRGAWSGAPVATPAGPEVRVRPLPAQTGGPPILLGAFAAVGVRRAGRLADGWIAPELARPEQLWRRLAELDLERPTREPFHIVLTTSAFVAADDAWARVRPGVERVAAQYRSWLQDSGDLGALPDRRSGEPPAELAVGTVADCVAALTPWWAALASLPDTVRAHVTVRTTFPGVSVRDTLGSVRLLGEEVVPALDQTVRRGAGD